MSNTTAFTPATGIASPVSGGRRDRVGFLTLALSVMMTSIFFLVPLVRGWPLASKTALVMLALWTIVEEGLWLHGLVLLTRAGIWKTVTMWGAVTRVAATANLICSLLLAAAALCSWWSSASLGMWFSVVLLIGLCCITRLAGIIGAGVSIRRWARTSRSHWLDAAVRAFAFYFAIIDMLYLIIGAVSIIDVQWNSAFRAVTWMAATPLPLAAMTLVGLYRVSPDCLPDPSSNAFPVDLVPADAAQQEA